MDNIIRPANPSELKQYWNNMVIRSVDECEHYSHGAMAMATQMRPDYFPYYRGQGKNTFKLESGLARIFKDSTLLKSKELELFRAFKNWALKFEFVSKKTHETNQMNHELNWILLFQAQHLGLKTRLLDWTIDWKVALSFAVENPEYDKNIGQFWIFFCPKKCEQTPKVGKPGMHLYSIDPFELHSTYMINNPFWSGFYKEESIGEGRRLRQSGRFSIQNYENSIVPMEEQGDIEPLLIKLLVRGQDKQRIRNELMEMGLTLDWYKYKFDEEIEEFIKKLNDTL